MVHVYPSLIVLGSYYQRCYCGFISNALIWYIPQLLTAFLSQMHYGLYLKSNNMVYPSILLQGPYLTGDNLVYPSLIV